ncbi:TPA: DUF3085 domain-containing protein [Pseudomonas aeruginosa]|nr:DUF3085 domain-containing protein [Pseudomonas aeruginosa]HBO0987377.1 DUF3085 domain-containing protein [Pseudomonas aeruginosa]HEJ3532201.1 DUF3085 domain-containing protein [Pseudomonas aeruginosa]
MTFIDIREGQAERAKEATRFAADLPDAIIHGISISVTLDFLVDFLAARTHEERQLKAAFRRDIANKVLFVRGARLLFKGSDLRPVLVEAAANQCRVILAKDHGVYFLAEHGERLPDGSRKLLAYAVGCNPDVDAFDDWYDLECAELGGDDFVEYFDVGSELFQLVLDSSDDLELIASPTHLTLRMVPSASDTN